MALRGAVKSTVFIEVRVSGDDNSAVGILLDYILRPGKNGVGRVPVKREKKILYAADLEFGIGAGDVVCRVGSAEV